jgi:hypothetical protein
MLKKPLSIFLASRLIIAVLIVAIVSFALTQTETERRILEGTIINKNIGLVTVGSKNQPGQILTLSAGPKTDLIAFHTGDRIIIEYNADYIIQSISKLS